MSPSASMPMAAQARAAIGYLALACTGKRLFCRCTTAAAGYIGTADEDGPASRESVEYFRSQHAAEHALATGCWQQR